MIKTLLPGTHQPGVEQENFKTAEDFRRIGEPDEIRSLSMSYAELGSSGGDALEGSLGLLMQVRGRRRKAQHRKGYRQMENIEGGRS